VVELRSATKTGPELLAKVLRIVVYKKEPKDCRLITNTADAQDFEYGDSLHIADRVRSLANISS
jgi:hypothetical protein